MKWAFLPNLNICSLCEANLVLCLQIQTKAEMGISSDPGTNGSRSRYFLEDDSASSKDREFRQDLAQNPPLEGGNDGRSYRFGSHTSIQIPEITNFRVNETELSTNTGLRSQMSHILAMIFFMILRL